MVDQSSSVMMICPDAGSIFHEPMPCRHTVVTPLNSIQVLSAVRLSYIDRKTNDGFGDDFWWLPWSAVTEAHVDGEHC